MKDKKSKSFTFAEIILMPLVYICIFYENFIRIFTKFDIKSFRRKRLSDLNSNLKFKQNSLFCYHFNSLKRKGITSYNLPDEAEFRKKMNSILYEGADKDLFDKGTLKVFI